MRIHLVDGTYELFRAYYGAPDAKGRDGSEVGATRGLLRSLLSLLNEEGVSHVACAFDHVIESFRNDLFEGYKTSEGVPEDLMAQFPLAERAAQALGLVVWPMVEFEADDAMATAAARWADSPEVEQVLLCTPDKDLAQCVRGSRVVLYDRMRRRILDERAIVSKFGVSPRSIPDYLALVGDTADGIPGAPRWGAKSAATLLARYEHLEAIPSDETEWSVAVRGAEALATSFREHRKELDLYRTLATLRTDVPLAEGIDDLRWRGARRSELKSLCHALDDDGFVERVDRSRD